MSLARRVYARRDGGFLFKENVVENIAILSLKEELVDLREWLMGVIKKID